LSGGCPGYRSLATFARGGQNTPEAVKLMMIMMMMMIIRTVQFAISDGEFTHENALNFIAILYVGTILIWHVFGIGVLYAAIKDLSHGYRA
jgi:hypothetical protein